MLSATDLAKNVAKSAEISQADAKVICDHVFQAIADAILDPSVGGVRTALGTFELVQRDARNARNPATGETISVGPSYAPKFKFSSVVKKTAKELKVAKKGKAAAAPAKAPAKPAKAAAAPARGKAAAPTAKGKGKAAAPVAKAAKQAAPAAKPAAKSGKGAPTAKGKPGKRR